MNTLAQIDVKKMEQKMLIPTYKSADKKLIKRCLKRIAALYEVDGQYPQEILSRLEQELNLIVNNHTAGLFLAHADMLQKSKIDESAFFTRGTIGNSFVSFLLGITAEINPLPTHLHCYTCNYSSFDKRNITKAIDDGSCKCLICGNPISIEGYDLIPEYAFGPDGERILDFSFCVASDNRKKLIQKLKAGRGVNTIYNIGVEYTGEADGKAFTYADADKSENYGLHPSSVVIIPRGCHKERRNLSPKHWKGVKGKVITKNFRDFDDTFFKTEITPSDLCEKIREYKHLTGLDPADIPYDDKETVNTINARINDFLGNAAKGTVRINSFMQLVDAFGYEHMTADYKKLPEEVRLFDGDCTRKAIAYREDIVGFLSKESNCVRAMAIELADRIGRGKGLRRTDVDILRQEGVAEWKINYLSEIKYLFPKAHGIAYCTQIWRMAFYQSHFPKICMNKEYMMKDVQLHCDNADSVIKFLTIKNDDFELLNNRNDTEFAPGICHEIIPNDCDVIYSKHVVMKNGALFHALAFTNKGMIIYDNTEGVYDELNKNLICIFSYEDIKDFCRIYIKDRSNIYVTTSDSVDHCLLRLSSLGSARDFCRMFTILQGLLQGDPDLISYVEDIFSIRDIISDYNPYSRREERLINNFLFKR